MKDLNVKVAEGENMHRHTHSWQSTQARAAVAGRGSAREWGRILAAPGAGRRGGPQLAVSEIDSRLSRKLRCVESQAEAQSRSGAQRDFFQKGN